MVLFKRVTFRYLRVISQFWKGLIDLSRSDFFLYPHRAGYKGQTYKLVLRSGRLHRRSGAFSVHVVKYWNKLRHLWSRHAFKKTLGSPMVQNSSWNTCVIYISLRQHFLHFSFNLRSLTLPPSFNKALCLYVRLLLALAANPTITKWLWLWFIMVKSRPQRAWRNHIYKAGSWVTYRHDNC